MTCGEAYQAILEADLPELDGTGTSSLAEHLESCPRCRALADTILSQESALAKGLVEFVPEIDLDRLLQEAETPHAPAARVAVDPSERAETSLLPRLKRLRRPVLALSPLAAAAVLAALFLGRPPRLPGPAYQPPERVAGLEVEVREGQSMAVLETDNPEITVLWLF